MAGRKAETSRTAYRCFLDDGSSFSGALYRCVSEVGPKRAENLNSAERLVYFAGSKEFLEFRDQLNPLQVAYVLDACEWIASDEYFSDDNRERIKTNRNTLADLGCA